MSEPVMASEPHGDGSMSNASTAGACDAVRGAYGQPGHIWLAATVETFGRRVDEWAENATDRARLAEIILAAPDLCASHEALRSELAALTTRLAAVERAAAVYREALVKLAAVSSWTEQDTAYLIGCHPRCEALGALEEVTPDLDLRTLGYQPEEAPDGG